ncbi:hypothetical protein SLEP1_g39759 [Rubroshorea leprosula]|uniref:Uncharacterized protein n=1 Tax=Rubroshorea leprosula TaxID=152421 RepID=A0AAV5L1P7_9ROSI|nr:hypothetical protein SLEP1_g39759 [Rubroshorea leprosula]
MESCCGPSLYIIRDAKLAEKLLVEAIFENVEGDSFVIDINFTIRSTGKQPYTARTTFYTSQDPEWYQRWF